MAVEELFNNKTNKLFIMSAIKTIGFGGTYYTLWEVYPAEKVILSDGAWYETQQFVYIQNLSKDLDTAKSKVKGEYAIDLSLKGKGSFTIESGIQGNNEDAIPNDCFQFGRYRGELISDVADLKYTKWYYSEVEGEAKKAAKDYIISQGYDFYYNEILQSDEVSFKKELDSLPRGHFYQPKERIEVSIKEAGCYSWEGYYGVTYFVTYITECGKVLYYKGSNPLNLSKSEYRLVKATVKHDSWSQSGIRQYTDEDGNFEATFLQRIKIVD